MKNLVGETIEKIKKQHIKPEPKWKYRAKRNSLWLIFGAALVLAAMSFSAASEVASQLDWDLYRFTRQSSFIYFLSIVPYFWLVLAALFLLAAFFEIRRTETGYRFSLIKISVIIIGGIIAFGLAMVAFGIGGRLNMAMSKNFSFYGKHMLMTKESQWMQPQKGFLSGTIQSISEKNIDLQDLNGESWDISVDEKTLIRPSVSAEKGEIIKIIGQENGKRAFRASEIRPWMGKGMMNGNSGQGRKMMNGRGGGGKMGGN